MGLSNVLLQTPQVKDTAVTLLQGDFMDLAILASLLHFSEQYLRRFSHLSSDSPLHHLQTLTLAGHLPDLVEDMSTPVLLPYLLIEE